MEDERERDLTAYLSDIEDAEREIDRLERENQQLRRAIEDCWYMAKRYADGRMTFAASTYNQHTRALLALGVGVRPVDGGLFARDGMGRKFDGLTDEEAKQGEPLELWRYSVLMEGFEEA